MVMGYYILHRSTCVGDIYTTVWKQPAWKEFKATLPVQTKKEDLIYMYELMHILSHIYIEKISSTSDPNVAAWDYRLGMAMGIVSNVNSCPS